MKIADAAVYMTEKLTSELKKIIVEEKHVKTGFMLRTSEVTFLSSTYEGKIRFIFSLKVPSYFSIVEQRRMNSSQQSMLQLLKASETYRQSMQIFYSAIVEEYGEKIKQQLINKKEFQNLN